MLVLSHQKVISVEVVWAGGSGFAVPVAVNCRGRMGDGYALIRITTQSSNINVYNTEDVDGSNLTNHTLRVW
jgi:hypothetical protein